MNVEATKFYIRRRGGLPETELQSYADHGFRSFGVETAGFSGPDDILNMEDLGPTVGIAGYIDDVKWGLERIGKPLPENVDYPPELAEFMGRNITRGTLEAVRMRPGYPMFVKPVEHKLFNGFVWDGSELSRRKIVTQRDDIEVWMSEPVEMLAEFRSMILDDEIQDVRLYKGDWSLAPDRRVLEEAVVKMKGHSPRAYCLDWAVKWGIRRTGRNRETILVEMNDGYAFGHYGMKPTTYARMLSARWNEMAS